jgi:dihydroorotate dehydrogenase
MPEIFRTVVEPVLEHIDSERAHVAAQELLHLAESTPVTLQLLEQFAYRRERFEDSRLRVTLGGMEFENPLLVGAGWDKKGRAVRALHRLGFAGVEVGSVLALPQYGNDKPRQWMIGPGVAMNRLGFNSPGMYEVIRNLERYREDGIPVGISVGKNKEVPQLEAPEAHAEVVFAMYPYAAYFAINVSSPNTPNLRELQDKTPLTDIAQAVNQAMDFVGGRKPVFIKIAPDLTNEAIDDVIDVVLTQGLTGIIATNTTIRDDIKAKYGRQGEQGGVSGNDPDFRRMANEKIAHIYKVAGDSLEIIGVGGIHDTQTALEKISAGAKAIQVVTAIRAVGPSLPGKINRGIIDFIEYHGVQNISELVGVNL